MLAMLHRALRQKFYATVLGPKCLVLCEPSARRIRSAYAWALSGCLALLMRTWMALSLEGSQ